MALTSSLHSYIVANFEVFGQTECCPQHAAHCEQFGVVSCPQPHTLTIMWSLGLVYLSHDLSQDAVSGRSGEINQGT